MVAGWIAETEAVEQMRLDQAITKVPRRLTEEEIAAMATKLGDLRNYSTAPIRRTRLVRASSSAYV
ncbi:hypothetical protein ACQP2T_01355 [Nonomuraea sp. CA-143628]|uniref:hypothetical protein n=1 Tax=Nonomuraea sp. CA-143628 TaxID=3239997 RepID=UPI003D901C31